MQETNWTKISSDKTKEIDLSVSFKEVLRSQLEKGEMRKEDLLRMTKILFKAKQELNKELLDNPYFQK